MREITNDLGVKPLLEEYKSLGGVLDYFFLEFQDDQRGVELHRAAALHAMKLISYHWLEHALTHCSPEVPIERFGEVKFDANKLSAQQVDNSTFWKINDITKVEVNEDASMPPYISAYELAFFDPPYGMQKSKTELYPLFKAINRYVFGDEPRTAEFYAWSTDWSNYFDAGHEWWGAFYWTIRPAGLPYIVVIGASATD